MNTPRLETERLILRKFTEDDLEALYYIHSDEEVNQVSSVVYVEKYGRCQSILRRTAREQVQGRQGV